MNCTDLNSALNLMWQGMLGIFIVMATIALIVYLFTKIPK
ncbi:MAG: sodium pump decarboxylase gamma subunit [Clostridia bacterium]|nr:sodium pump decarboxylase gamma subunit [Clostridia bacterium]